MLIRKAPDLTYADVTRNRSISTAADFSAAMGIAGAAALAGARLWNLGSPRTQAFAAHEIRRPDQESFSTTEKQNSYNDVTH